MEYRDYFYLIVFIVGCELVGIIGALVTSDAFVSWYPSLEKPWFTPPGYVFAPVWTLLYALMGIALYIVWKKGWPQKKAKYAVSAFAIQLTLNGIWTPLFFGLRNPLLGLIDIILLWIAILVTIVLFTRISKKAGALLIPYIIWVTIATALNYSIWASIA
ncbi:MAG: Tryptophan-rich sensory protein TspO [Candidatus Methanohalarchaeum thermophilum]|uniref:Tryptophan-rich sensory protein TspO n=1 Tax=Methanohalarchaeum thermophilum TaxID=1903181 RepID=A0A1Q6DSY5_METT1|nr:MAG: Tryptophan-rich sensory protein TspO [Candidatus Methanohalarchaeum thermophilum]